jgi:phage terminase small subunit
MGAPRKPSALKAIQGTDKQNPERTNKNEPVPVRGIGPNHSSLDEYEAAIWDEVVGISYAGVLGEADRIALEMMCRLIAEMRLDFVEMTAAKITQLSQLLGRFGMTPSDRTKIVIPKGKAQNPFEDM